MQQRHRPVALVLTRQKLPTLDRERFAAPRVERGAYVLTREHNPQVILIGTGSEVSLCLAAAERLAEEGLRVRVVSMPSWELFEEQDESYRREVLPPEVRARVSVEQASTFGWARYVGADGHVIGVPGFGASAPIEELQQKFGFTVDAVVAAARSQVERAESAGASR